MKIPALAILALVIASSARAEAPVTREEAAAAVLHSVPSHSPAAVPALERAPALSHVVYGYYPDYAGSDLSRVHFDLLTHVGYFTGGCTASGAYSAGNWPFDSLVAAAHASGTKVMLVIPCFGDAKITSVLANQGAFIDAVVAAMGQGAMPDGIDLDFEGMGAEHLGDFPGFVASLISAVRAVNPAAEFSAALPSVDWNQAYDYPALASELDRLTIMAYGYHYSGGDPGPVSPLSYAGAWTGYTYDIGWSVNDYETAIADTCLTAKIVLGLPYYGYDWPSTSFAMPGTKSANGSSRRYDAAMTLAGGGSLYDAGSQTKYYFYEDAGTKHQLWFDDAETLAMKYEAAKDGGLGGVAIWALTYDGNRPELWQAIADEFSVATPAPTETPTPAPTATATPSPNPSATPGNAGDPGSSQRGCDVGGFATPGADVAILLALLALATRVRHRDGSA